MTSSQAGVELPLRSILPLKRLRFPGVAGQLQQEQAVASLIRELGDNYPIYHAFLGERLQALGGRPQPERFTDDVAGFAEAYADFQDIVIAELVLRRAYVYRTGSEPFSLTPPPGPPIVDSNDQLTGLEIQAGTSALDG